MVPTAGRVLHYNYEGKWLPMLVTSFGERPDDVPFVSGWCFHDPKLSEGAASTATPVIDAFPGEGPGNWRWPPRV